MDWLKDAGVIDAALGALILQDLRSVAEADEELHERELSLIDAFVQALPTDAEPATSVQDPTLQRVYLRAVLLIAVIDGELSEPEYLLILELADKRGIPRSEVDRVARAVVRDFFGTDTAHSEFLSSLQTVALDLGFNAEQVEQIWN